MDRYGWKQVWKRQPVEAQVCLATAGGVLLTAAGAAAWSLAQPRWSLVYGLAAVGVFYLALGAWAVNWSAAAHSLRRWKQSRKDQPRRSVTVRWHRSRLRQLAASDQVARQVWENN